MQSALFILTGLVVIIAGLIIYQKIKFKLKLKAKQKQKARIAAIKPEILFYLKEQNTQGKGSVEIALKNSGFGPALDIEIEDFHHPEEKDWHFKFQNIDRLDPGQESSVEFEFYVGEYKAANKTEQLWMFDPDHDHDFAARLTVSFTDMDHHHYKTVIIIGEDKKDSSKKVGRYQLIQDIMARK